jgi:hypothetical protein
MNLTKEQKNRIILALDKVARGYNEYEYGLPYHDDGLMALMREAIDESLKDEKP